ncbi:hypothetical protein [Wolbachia endosymbiont of Ctenocephalides felis wCfeT]|uniref:hypothetical protein n=1 Tax=Wolbachia endosymbiont of Ctenocephalides felis wCfeT TaxID=2732593 RepID=UPI0015841E12|nr:hypothetical protein [Wolbachia endosymbiont of Ctenocephalides felis wCfeT]
MTDSLTVWQSIEILTKAILNMQEELSLIKNINPDQNVTLEKGKELSNNIYEAKLKLNGEFYIATLSKIGYRISNGALIVRNHVTAEEIKIPKEFRYLKVVSPDNGDRKLTFCNVLGNEFFEYKKYDPQFSSIPNDYKFVDFGSISKAHNAKFKEHIGHAPSFFAAEWPIEPGSQNHSIVLFGLNKCGKGKKIEMLTDEFGYFDDQGNFNYCNYHKSATSSIYDPGKFDVKMISLDVSKIDKFYLIAEQGNIVLNPILENLGIF